MFWVALLALCSVAAQSPQNLLPAGVTISQVTQIQTFISGSVAFDQSTDGSTSYITTLPYPVVISFNNVSGVLTVTSSVTSVASFLKPGLLAAFLALGLFSLSPNKNNAFVCVLLFGLGVATAASVNPDFIIYVPGCWHTTTNGTSLLFDSTCSRPNGTNFTGVASPCATVSSAAPDLWEPVNPQTAFLPATDAGMHYLDPINQYEVWRSQFGLSSDPVSLSNFLTFTARCKQQNLDPNRGWTAGCNQFSDQTHEDWTANVLAGNSQILNNANGRRRLLENVPVLEVPEATRRKLLATTSFSWVGTGKLTAVKDQGQCGDCYAHSTSSTMEAFLSIVYGTVPFMLSREQLKDCSVGAPGCNGGDPAYMFTYAQGAQGLTTEALLPYQYNTATPSNNIPCASPLPAAAYTNSGYNAISNNEAAFKVALQTGPIAVTVCADTWDNYAGGIFTNCATGCSVDHAVMLVGFGTDSTVSPPQNYWLIQNSWNTWWGEQGFIRLSNTGSSTAGVGMCGLTTYPGYQPANPQAVGVPTPAGTQKPTPFPTPQPTYATGTQKPTPFPTPHPTGTAQPTPASRPCTGTWSAWSACSQTCGGGTQSRTWTTTSPAVGTGAACPNPLTQQNPCNTKACPGVPVGPCVKVSNSVLSGSGDGSYTQVSGGWSEPGCCGGSYPTYQFTNANQQVISLFWWTGNCMIYGTSTITPTAGQWCLGPGPVSDGTYYECANSQEIVNGAIPPVNTATGWTIQIGAGSCGSG